jgi:predicted RNA-binding Zn ribbon-like protein
MTLHWCPMPRKPPRYDLPNAAPEPLRLVQRFVNTIDISHDREWLTGWLDEEGLGAPPEADLARARAVREAIRELLYANNGHANGGEPLPALDAAAEAARLTIDFEAAALVPRAGGLDGLLGRVLVVCFEAMREGSFRRLKCCRNVNCRWSFYDYSKNRSATWCSMQICGNRTKTATYRARSR